MNDENIESGEDISDNNATFHQIITPMYRKLLQLDRYHKMYF